MPTVTPDLRKHGFPSAIANNNEFYIAVQKLDGASFASQGARVRGAGWANVS